MSVWLKDATPCTFGGMPVRLLDADKAVEFFVVKQTAINRLGTATKKQGGAGDVLTHTFVFADTEFQLYKVFEEKLKMEALLPAPTQFIHPIEGVKGVTALNFQTNIKSEQKAAFVRVTFQVDVRAPSQPPIGLGAPILFKPGGITVNMAAYARRVALQTAMQSAILSALLLLIGQAGEFPAMLAASVDTLGDQLEAFAENKFGEGFTDTRRADHQLKKKYESMDAEHEEFKRKSGLREAMLDKITGGESYDAGFCGGGNKSGVGDSTPKEHAALVLLSVMENFACGYIYNSLVKFIQEGNAEAASAEAAALYWRGRVQRANRLIAASMPYDAGEITGQNSRLAQSLMRLLQGRRLSRPPARVIELPESNKPLVLLALEYLGDGDRAEEIRDLNDGLLLNFNRLPRGTMLSIPAA